MYLRTKVFHNRDGTMRTHLQLVTGERVGGRVRQRVVANLGRLEELQEGAKAGGGRIEAAHRQQRLMDLSQLKAVEIRLDGRRYLARTELTGQASLAFKALGMRPPLHVQEMPCTAADRDEACCGT